jgi:ABC-type Fe3+-hydroxamate transport system substrate-binding protein
MVVYIDQMNNSIRLEKAPGRIVTLVPSQTQLLHSLGLQKEVIGITKFCIHPNDWYVSKARIGGTKTIDIEKVRSLQPDLILGNKEENSKEDIEALRNIAPVWMSDVSDLGDAIDMIRSVGELTGKKNESVRLIEDIEGAFKELSQFVAHYSNDLKSVLYLIWHKPNLAAGKNTFIDDMISQCGWTNIIDEKRYPEASEIVTPEIVFLSSEPFPFKIKHVEMFEKIYPDAKIVLVDGEQFSWYGSKLKEAPYYFMDLIKELSADC